MIAARISLDQWKALVSVVDSGGYAKAAEQLHKSQSTLTYAIQKMERLLGVRLFEIRGRKAVLTEPGKVLYARARDLLDDAARLERAAAGMAAGWEPELRLAVEVVFPTWLLLDCLARFGAERPETRIELYETVLGGNTEMLLEGRVDLAIGPVVPPGFLGDRLMQVRLVAAAHPDHPLHRLGRPVGASDLKPYRHLVLRETGSRRARATSIVAHQRWTVSNKATWIRAATMGQGFAWFPEESIREELQAGTLARLPMREGAERFGDLYLIHADREAAGPGARRLAQILRERVRETCVESAPPA